MMDFDVVYGDVLFVILSLNLGEQRCLCICQFRDPREALPIPLWSQIWTDLMSKISQHDEITMKQYE